MTSSELRRVAKALYELPPARFTAARNEAAREAGRADAAAIKRLPKAQATAWAVTALAREDGSLFEEILELGRRLRLAQTQLDPDALRSLGGERQKLLARASGRARELAGRAGVVLSGSAMIEISQTLQAAMTDDEAAAAVRGGLLLRGLSVSGWDPVALDGAVAIAPNGTTPDARPARSGRPRASGADPDAAAEARRVAEAAAWRAMDDVASAHAKVAAVDSGLAELAERREELEAERSEIEERLRGVEADLAEVYRGIQVGTREKKSAERDEMRATRRAKQAQEKLDQG